MSNVCHEGSLKGLPSYLPPGHRQRDLTDFVPAADRGPGSADWHTVGCPIAFESWTPSATGIPLTSAARRLRAIRQHVETRVAADQGQRRVTTGPVGVRHESSGMSPWWPGTWPPPALITRLASISLCCWPLPTRQHHLAARSVDHSAEDRGPWQSTEEA